MTEVERLEAQQKRQDEARKETAKRLRAAKRREARKQAQAKKEAEQADAVMFVEFCKQHKITFGSGENQTWKYAYDWLALPFEKWKAVQNDGAPGRAQ